MQCSPLTDASSLREGIMKRDTKVRSKKQRSATVEPSWTVLFEEGNQPSLSREPATNIEALENVIEDEPHFFMEIVDNDLHALTMITKHFMSKHWKWIIGSQRQKLWWQSGGGLVIHGANGEDYLDGYDGAGGGEFKGGGVDLGVVNSLLGEIPGDVMGERGGDTIGVDGGAVW
ncbi:hypothetical protein Tco_0313151 [Tanacetum coccineum]